MIPAIHSHIARVAAAAIAILAFQVIVHGQVVTWDGAGSGATWTAGANWAGGVAPASASTTQIAFGGSTNLSPDMNQNWSVNSLAFNSGASAFTLGSSGGYTLTIYSGGLANNSTNTQTVNSAVSLGATRPGRPIPVTSRSPEASLRRATT
jgi:hypothetical protein